MALSKLDDRSFFQLSLTPSGREILWRKYRRRILIGIGLVGVAGVGVYWYWSYSCRLAAELQQRRLLQDERQRELQRIREEQANAEADARLQSHYEEMQVIADTTTLPSVLPHLRARLFALIDLTPLTQALVAGRSSAGGSGAESDSSRGEGRPGAPLTAQEKMRIWEDLKFLSFSRALGSMWAVALLFLFVRTQLNILGRRMYLNAASEEEQREGAHGGRGRASEEGVAVSSSTPFQGSRDLSMRCQHEYIAFADYLAHRGLSMLLEDVQATMERALSSRDLKERFSGSELRRLLMDLRAEFEAGHAHRWPQYLLPTENALPQELAAASLAADVAHTGTVSPLEELLWGGRPGSKGASNREGGSWGQRIQGISREESTAQVEERAPGGGRATEFGGVEAEGRGEVERGVGGAEAQEAGEGGESGRPTGSEDPENLEELMWETRFVLHSAEFTRAVVAIANAMTDMAMDELGDSAYSRASGPSPGASAHRGQQAASPHSTPPLPAIPLAKLLPPVAALAVTYLEADENGLLDRLSEIAEVKAFSSFVYAGMG